MTKTLEKATQLSCSDPNVRDNALRRVNLRDGKAMSLEEAYAQNQIVECFLPRGKYVHIRKGFVSPCGFIYRSKEDFDYFTED